MIIKTLRVLICGVLLNSFTSCEPSTLVTDHSPKGSCSVPSELKLCKLDADKLTFVGELGRPGEKGSKGDTGEAGKNGSPGEDGLKGSSGIDGEPGAPGLRGVKGDMGPQGPPGRKGAIGKQGLVSGPEGPKGDTGAPGTPGTNKCVIDESYDDDEEEEDDEHVEKEWATRDKHGTVTCRNAPIKESGVYYLLPSLIEVFCDFKTGKTCVSHNSDKVINYKESEPFWLSQKDVSLEDIYNLTSAQLSWLQRESYTANMTIRYHCMNSIPIGKDAMTLLSWNDVKVSHEPTPSSPFQYFVQNDGCSTAAGNTWSYTDIVLVSTIAQRLPIVDFFIKDVRNTTQALRIEIRQLCFG